MCTGIRLKALDNSIIYARTLEFGQDLKSAVLMIPRNHTINGTAPSGKPGGLVWKTSYAALGLNALGFNIFVDGLNEKGLAGGLFYFPGYAHYQDVTQEEIPHSIAAWELLTFLLTTCASVAEVKIALNTIKVSCAIFEPWNMELPIHVVVHDETGASLVIEYINGALYTYDCSLGVITNVPSFDWHMTNVNNYINLNPVNITSKNLGKVALVPLGQGSGMHGMPGDFTSPSRFIRAVFLSQSVTELATVDQALKTAFHVLNLFDIPHGVVREEEGKEVFYDHTLWTSACDLMNRTYHFHTYDDRKIRSFALKSMELGTGCPVTWPMTQ